MADKIKSFFQRKKTNAKFMNAGKGYRLTDSTSSTVPASREPKQPIQRVEPTEEAKIAGRAALARFEAKKTDGPKFNTSYAAIQARVKRELEQERKALENAQKEEKEKSEQKTKEPVEDSPLLAVTDVYFRCPYLSAEICTKKEWKKKIREFLYNLLESDEAGLTACLIIQNCNTGSEKINSCVETLGKYLDNIIMNPDVEKYRKIKMSNRIFKERVLPMEGALEFLKAAGFQQQKLPLNDVEEEFLVWDPKNCNIEDLTMLAEALRSAEPIPLELDRNLQVLLPQQAHDRKDLPPSFFMILPEELKREQQHRSEQVELSQMLRTKAMREKSEQRELRNYKYSLIRIKFPDSIILQGTFSVHEKFENVIDFVKENLATCDRQFQLQILAGQVMGEDCYDKTLLELKLVPAVFLIFTWKSSMPTDQSANVGYIKEELLYYIQPI